MVEKIKTLEELATVLDKELKNKQGSIMVYLDGVPKISHTNDIIGNCLQEWLPARFIDLGLDLEPNPHTQEFPDFIAHFDNYTIPMDIKCWNYDRSPAFDIANFDSFYKETYEKPDKLLGKYLVLGYSPNKHGFLIKYVGLKSLWELMGPGKNYPIKLQVKRGNPYAIRPINIKNYSKGFDNIYSLLQAVRDTRKLFSSPLIDELPPDKWYTDIVNGLKDNPLAKIENSDLK